jgi:hypothetical protein
VSYFFEEAPSPEYVKDLHLATKLNKEGVTRIALRASDLDERGKQAVLEMIELVRKAQAESGRGHSATP